MQTAVRHAGGRRVVVVSMRLGALRQVVPDTPSFAFELAGTACEVKVHGSSTSLFTAGRDVLPAELCGRRGSPISAAARAPRRRWW